MAGPLAEALPEPAPRRTLRREAGPAGRPAGAARPRAARARGRRRRGRATSPVPSPRSGWCAGPGWPHDDSADALRPHAEHGDPDRDADVWLVVDGETVVGDLGLAGPPDDDGDQEIGYGLAAPARGQGLATEAVAVLCTWLEQQDEVHRVVAEVEVGNDAVPAAAGAARLHSRAGHPALRALGPRRAAPPAGPAHPPGGDRRRAARLLIRIEQPVARFAGVTPGTERPRTPDPVRPPRAPEARMTTTTLPGSVLPERPRRAVVKREPTQRSAARALRRTAAPTTGRTWSRAGLPGYPKASAGVPLPESLSQPGRRRARLRAGLRLDAGRTGRLRHPRRRARRHVLRPVGPPGRRRRAATSPSGSSGATTSRRSTTSGTSSSSRASTAASCACTPTTAAACGCAGWRSPTRRSTPRCAPRRPPRRHLRQPRRGAPRPAPRGVPAAPPLPRGRRPVAAPRALRVRPPPPAGRTRCVRGRWLRSPLRAQPPAD